MNSSHSIGSTNPGAAAKPSVGGELWLFTQDHRRLAWMYAIVIGLSLVVGTVLAVGLGLQPLTGRGTAADAESYRRLYSMHGLVMVFLVALPALPGIVGNWLLPERLGVDEMAWPRMNLLAFQLLLVGCVFFLVAFFATPLDTGWDFALPYALKSNSSVAWGMLGIVFVGASFATSGANIVATVITSRGNGRCWSDLPFFAWAMGAAGLIQAIVTPVLLTALALLFAQREGASDVFASSGADVRFDQWFWFWAHPALASMLLAAIAVIGDVVGEHGDRPRGASRASVLSVMAITVFAFAGWGIHVLGRTDSAACDTAFSALVLASGVPLIILIVDWVTTLERGEARATTALGYAATSVVALTVGGMAGVFLAVPGTGAHLQNTSFSTGVLHFLVVGGVLGALLSGVHQLWPRWLGVAAREGWGKFGCFLFFVGVNLAFVPLCVRGYLGQPRRTLEVVAADERLGWYAVLGAVLIIGALTLAAWNLVATLLDSRATLAKKEAD
ncbi:MAG: cbb3-type cytochrome c oxidase subunit I [Planctomycetes bacterium]|nr:cbb3-type cytochrome c oxidase subunit I [Planctomycetota bacterium]